MPQLILYNDYSREEVHDIFDQKSTFTNGSRANSIFEAVVLTDLDFIKLAAHPDYAPKEPVADGFHLSWPHHCTRTANQVAV